MPRRIALVALLVAAPLAALVMVAGSRHESARGGAVEVVASIYPLADFARAIGGGRVAVRTFVPPGTEPHDYEPTPRDIIGLHRARIFVHTGAGFEPWADRVTLSLPASVRVIAATRGLSLLGRDPHVWLDPVAAQGVVAVIAEGMAAADPEGADVYTRGAGALRATFAALHREFAEGLARCDQRVIVTTHAAFGYLARRYGLEQVALAGLSPAGDPGPAAFARLARTLRQRGVRTVFVERLGSPRAAQALAREIGAEVLTLDSLEGLPAGASSDATYVTLMRANLATLRTGLGCD